MKNLKNTLKYYLLEKQSKWNLLIVIVPFIGILIYNNIKLRPLDEGNYTVGYVYRIYWPLVNAKTIMYSYTVYKNQYTNAVDYNSNHNPKEEQRYLVQFSSEDNSISKIFQDIPVPDSIKEAPAEGWREMPKWAKQIENENR